MSVMNFKFNVKSDNSYSDEFNFNLAELSDVYGGVKVVECNNLPDSLCGIEITGGCHVARIAAKQIYNELDRHLNSGLLLMLTEPDTSGERFIIKARKKYVEREDVRTIASHRFFFDVDDDKSVSAVYRIFETEITLNGTETKEDNN